MSIFNHYCLFCTHYIIEPYHLSIFSHYGCFFVQIITIYIMSLLQVSSGHKDKCKQSNKFSDLMCTHKQLWINVDKYKTMLPFTLFDISYFFLYIFNLNTKLRKLCWIHVHFIQDRWFIYVYIYNKILEGVDKITLVLHFIKLTNEDQSIHIISKWAWVIW